MSCRWLDLICFISDWEGYKMINGCCNLMCCSKRYFHPARFEYTYGDMQATKNHCFFLFLFDVGTDVINQLSMANIAILCSVHKTFSTSIKSTVQSLCSVVRVMIVSRSHVSSFQWHDAQINFSMTQRLNQVFSEIFLKLCLQWDIAAANATSCN